MKHPTRKNQSKMGRRSFLSKLFAGAALAAVTLTTGLKSIPSRLLPGKVTGRKEEPGIPVSAPGIGNQVVVGPGEEMVLSGSRDLGDVQMAGGVISVESSGVYTFERLAGSPGQTGGQS